jgi:multisubunit Na+/H+ antiporter MnhB subunit
MRYEILLILLCVFGIIATKLPPFGAQISLVGDYYLKNSLDEVGSLNVVESVIWLYRGLDTLGEILILSTTSIIIFMFAKENLR